MQNLESSDLTLIADESSDLTLIALRECGADADPRSPTGMSQLALVSMPPEAFLFVFAVLTSEALAKEVGAGVEVAPQLA